MLNKLKNEIELSRRHIDVIRVVASHQPIGIMKLAELLGIPSHRVRYSLKVLEQLGYIRASPAGATATPMAKDLIANLDIEIDELISELEAMKEGIRHNP